jgi:hypothetical protein
MPLSAGMGPRAKAGGRLICLHQSTYVGAMMFAAWRRLMNGPYDDDEDDSDLEEDCIAEDEDE